MKFAMLYMELLSDRMNDKRSNHSGWHEDRLR